MLAFLRYLLHVCIGYLLILLIACSFKNASLKYKEAPYQGPDISGEWRIAPAIAKTKAPLGTRLELYSTGTFEFKRLANGQFSAQASIIKKVRPIAIVHIRFMNLNLVQKETSASEIILHEGPGSKNKRGYYNGPKRVDENWLPSEIEDLGEVPSAKPWHEFRLYFESDNLFAQNERETLRLVRIEKPKRINKPVSLKATVHSKLRSSNSINIIGVNLAKRIKAGYRVEIFKKGKVIARGRVSQIFHSKAKVKLTAGYSQVQNRDAVLVFRR